MRDFGNDLAHIAFACLILGLTHYGIYGYAFAGLLLGVAIELKEENSNILKVSLTDLSLRDITGYIIGALLIGIVLLSGCVHIPF